MAIYMKIDGFNGNVTAKGHENWIEMESLSFNVARSINAKPGNIADREHGVPKFEELELRKHIDSSSANIFQQACKGKALSTVNIEICGTDDSLQPYVKLALSNVIVSCYGLEASAGDSIPMEVLKLNYTKLEKTFIPRDAANKPQSPMTAGYDLNAATSV